NQLFDAIGPSYNNVYITFVAPQWEKVGGSAANFVAAAQLRGDASYAPFAADAVNLIIHAISASQKNEPATPTRRSVLDALRYQKSYNGYGGTYRFNEWGDNSDGRVYLYTLTSGERSFTQCGLPACK